MNIFIYLLFVFIVQVNLRQYDHVNDISSILQREKKYSSRKKVLDDVDENEKSSRHSYSSRLNNHSRLSNTRNRLSSLITTTTQQNYIDEASLCINEYDIKTEQLVKVKELKNDAHLIRFVRIEEPSSSHGLDIRDICMLNCCVEKYCDLAMLSEQRTNDGYKCYLFACNGSCTYASHQDYTSMILKKDVLVDDESTSIGNKGSSDASSTTLATTCRSNEFSCRDGSCIPYYDVCNSYDDCPSGVDEAMCTPEFILHQRTQKENRLKPSVDLENDGNIDAEEIPVDELTEDDSTTTMKTITKSTTAKTSLSKSKSNNRDRSKTNKNLTTSYVYNIDLETQQQLSKLQKLKEHLEETKGPEAWYRLFQTLVQHQQQDHSNIEPEQSASSVTDEDDDDNFKDHLLALEQQWIAERQKTSTITMTTTIKSRVINRKTTMTTTKRMKIVNDEDLRERRPPVIIDDELTDEQIDEGEDENNNNDRYYWQPTFDDRQRDGYKKYPQKSRTTSITTTRKSKVKYPLRETSVTTLLRANNLEWENIPHGRSFLRESSVILLLLLGLTFTIVLLVLVGFYCRDSWKRGRMLKNRSTDADYLVNGLYL